MILDHILRPLRGAWGVKGFFFKIKKINFSKNHWVFGEFSVFQKNGAGNRVKNRKVQVRHVGIGK